MAESVLECRDTLLLLRNRFFLAPPIFVAPAGLHPSWCEPEVRTVLGVVLGNACEVPPRARGGSTRGRTFREGVVAAKAAILLVMGVKGDGCVRV